jgi:p-cumate 2,3-dioxygenase subunit beta
VVTRMPEQDHVDLDALTLHHRVEQFLYLEAAYLDEWELDRWLALFTDDAEYRVPTTDRPDGEGGEVLDIIFDDIVRLRGRIDRLKTRFAYREFPFSRTRRLISNVRILSHDEESVAVTSNFVVYRLRNGEVDPYMGCYTHRLLVGGEDGFRIQRRFAELDLEALRPHSTLSILL